jgi:hypothetical protein
MKIAVFTAIALSVLVGVATPAGAEPFNAKAFFDHMDRFSGGND